jgi:hypothetical protein
VTDDATRVTRQRKPSAVEMRAASEVSPRLTDATSVPPGPEQDAVLAGAFGAAFDIIVGEAKEMASALERLRGALANAEQGRTLWRERAERATARADLAESRAAQSERDLATMRREVDALRDTLRQLRGGR